MDIVHQETGEWQQYTIDDQDTTLGHLLRHHLLPFAHFTSCNMRHPLEIKKLQIYLQATPTSGKPEADRLLQQACKDTLIELRQFREALDAAAAAAEAHD